MSGLTVEQNIQGRAHNALAAALTDWMPLSERERLSAAVAAAVEPVIRADERARFLAASRDFPEPWRTIIYDVAWQDASRLLAPVSGTTTESEDLR